MNNEILQKEKEYLAVVEKQIKGNINSLSAFLGSEKAEIQEEKYAMRETWVTASDANDTFLDIYQRTIDYDEREKQLIQLKRMEKNPYFAICFYCNFVKQHRSHP